MRLVKSLKFWCRIVSLLCICCLLLSLPLVPVSGDDGTEPVVTIAFHNLAFANQVYILYAVDVANAGTEDVKPFMQFWKAEPDLSSNPAPDIRVEYLDYRSLKNVGDGKKYYVFVYTDLTARQMADVIYARAGVTVGDKTYYSELDDYSICEYAARQLGIIPGYSASSDEKLKDMLVSMLTYGTKAQLYFNYRPDCLANEFYLTFGGESLVPTNGIEYKLQDDGMVVTGYTGTETNIVIASTVDGKTVKRIQASAFSGSNIQSVYIPGTVEKIENFAFLNCTFLETVEMREGVKSIGEKAFEGCSHLKKVILPVSIEVLGISPFPDNDDMQIWYNGTSDQLDALLERSPNWNTVGKKFIRLSDGTIREEQPLY